MSDKLQQRLDFAVIAARASSLLTLEYFQSVDLAPDDKADGSPVTAADRACELDLRERIITAYPDDAILGEEFDDREGTTGYQWVIDPIDGTISFVHGVPLYGTMLACLKDGVPVLGVITMPALNQETVYGATGLGAFHQIAGNTPTRAQVSRTSELSKSMLATTSMDYFTTDPHRELFDRMHTQSRFVRGWSDCYAIVLLATGRVDGVIEPDVKIWDIASVPPIIAEAGGDWSAFSGAKSVDEGSIIASNGQLHEDLARMVR
ncbi:MAG: hypothetical protein KC996_01010 [Phycisphaerales bacterium]|nr:hypothetical protein [Phycisphaerales bacterium]